MLGFEVCVCVTLAAERMDRGLLQHFDLYSSQDRINTFQLATNLCVHAENIKDSIVIPQGKRNTELVLEEAL